MRFTGMRLAQVERRRGDIVRCVRILSSVRDSDHPLTDLRKPPKNFSTTFGLAKGWHDRIFCCYLVLRVGLVQNESTAFHKQQTLTTITHLGYGSEWGICLVDFDWYVVVSRIFSAGIDRISMAETAARMSAAASLSLESPPVAPGDKDSFKESAKTKGRQESVYTRGVTVPAKGRKRILPFRRCAVSIPDTFQLHSVSQQDVRCVTETIGNTIHAC